MLPLITSSTQPYPVPPNHHPPKLKLVAVDMVGAWFVSFQHFHNSSATLLPWLHSSTMLVIYWLPCLLLLQCNGLVVPKCWNTYSNTSYCLPTSILSQHSQLVTCSSKPTQRTCCCCHHHASSCWMLPCGLTTFADCHQVIQHRLTTTKTKNNHTSKDTTDGWWDDHDVSVVLIIVIVVCSEYERDWLRCCCSQCWWSCTIVSSLHQAPRIAGAGGCEINNFFPDVITTSPETRSKVTWLTTDGLCSSFLPSSRFPSYFSSPISTFLPSTQFYIMGHGDVIADISDIAENEWYKGCAAGEDRP